MTTVDGLFTLPTALFLVGVYVASLIVRRLVEALFPSLSTKTPATRAERVWEEVVLPAMPAAFGASFAALVPGYPYPGAITLPITRFLFGLAIGWFSAWGYKVVKFTLKKQWNIPFPDDTLPPPPDVAARVAAVAIPPPPDEPHV